MSEGEQIFSELVADCNREVAHWAQQALKAGEIDIFEIESASTVDEAKTSTAYWRDCFSWLGLNVISDRR